MYCMVVQLFTRERAFEHHILAYFRYDNIAEVFMPQSVECAQPNKTVIRDVTFLHVTFLCIINGLLVLFPSLGD